jgi:hypothetical protein
MLRLMRMLSRLVKNASMLASCSPEMKSALAMPRLRTTSAAVLWMVLDKKYVRIGWIIIKTPRLV